MSQALERSFHSKIDSLLTWLLFSKANVDTLPAFFKFAAVIKSTQRSGQTWLLAQSQCNIWIWAQCNLLYWENFIILAHWLCFIAYRALDNLPCSVHYLHKSSFILHFDVLLFSFAEDPRHKRNKKKFPHLNYCTDCLNISVWLLQPCFLRLLPAVWRSNNEPENFYMQYFTVARYCNSSSARTPSYEIITSKPLILTAHHQYFFPLVPMWLLLMKLQIVTV